jgi:hypothetical protein
MGRYLDMIVAALAQKPASEASTRYAKNAKNAVNGISAFNAFSAYRVSSLEWLRHVLDVLDGRCPEHVEHDRWRQAVDDGRCFLAAWGEQAERLGWTSKDLFGLFPVPENPHPSFSRLSRYGHTGLIWLLHRCPVIFLTEATAAIQNPSGAITIYRKHNKPALGPTGDSLDDLE